MLSLLTHKFTVGQYHQLGENNVLPPSDRVELMNGDILDLSPIGIRYSMAVKRLNAFSPPGLCNGPLSVSKTLFS